MSNSTDSSPQNQPAAQSRFGFSGPDWLVAGWFLAIKLALLVFGAKTYQVLENRRFSDWHGWLAIWNRWDSLHYLKIAETGYQATGILKAWFYPLFPWSVRLLAFLTGDVLVSAFVVSAMAGLAAVLVFRRLVQLDFSPVIAIRAVWFFLIFPTAYFFHIGYTESLFLAFALGSIFAARKERWWLAGILGACCWMTRPTGIALLPALAVEAAHQFWTGKRWNWRWLWIGVVPVGFGVYLLLNWKVSGDPFAFLKMRHKLFAMSMSWPWTSIREAVGNLKRPPSQAEMVGAEELSICHPEPDLHCV